MAAFAFIPLLFSLPPRRKQLDLGLQGVRQNNALGSQENQQENNYKGENPTGCVFPTTGVNQILLLLTQLYSVCFTLFGV